MSWGLVFDQSLIGRSIRIGVVAPEHVLAQLGAHGLHLVLGQLGTLGVEEGAAVLVLRNPVCKMRLEKNRGTNHLLLTNRFF